MLLVSCCGTGGGLFLIDEKTYEIEKVFPYDCTGITIGKDNIFAFSHTLRAICKFNLNFVLKDYKVVGRDFHGLSLYGDKLFAVDTYNDKICWYNSESLSLLSYWDFSNGSPGNDYYHINDMFPFGNKTLISMFRDIPGLLVENNPGKIYIYIKDDDSTNVFGRLFLDGLVQPHSPIIFNDEFWVCNSRKCSIIKGVLNSEGNLENKEEITIGYGFTRGLLVIDKYVYVGISSSLARPTENEFKQSPCGIVVLYKGTITEKQFIPLPANEVYNILCLPE